MNRIAEFEFVSVPVVFLTPAGPSLPSLFLWMIISSNSKNGVCELSTQKLFIYSDLPRDVFDSSIEELKDLRCLETWHDGGVEKWFAVMPADFGQFEDEEGVSSESVKLSSSKIRSSIWMKSCGACWYCGTQTIPFATFAIDHVIPQSKGGPNKVENLVPSCRSCNSVKRDKSVEEFRRYLDDKRPHPWNVMDDPIIFFFERRKA